MPKRIGILTSGGDCPGLNAAIRAVGKASRDLYGMSVVGFLDGFRGLVYDKTLALEGSMLSGILTVGGTILGTSRDKPHRMIIDGQEEDRTRDAIKTFERHRLDGLVCIGGGGTQKNALRLHKAGMNIITLPKTIDNDVPMTDVSFGFDTALGIVTEAIDRLHSTAMSHRRIIVVEVMGHRAGWLALGGGMAGGADVILLPEIPYDVEKVAEAVLKRSRAGKAFSIIVVAEGAMSRPEADRIRRLVSQKARASGRKEKKKASEELAAFHRRHVNHTMELTARLENMTTLETRLSILGHLQRGGSPSASDRLLATRLGTACAGLLSAGTFGVMVGARGSGFQSVPLDQVAGRKNLVPPEHPWIISARQVGTSFGD